MTYIGRGTMTHILLSPQPNMCVAHVMFHTNGTGDGKGTRDRDMITIHGHNGPIPRLSTGSYRLTFKDRWRKIYATTNIREPVAGPVAKVTEVVEGPNEPNSIVVQTDSGGAPVDTMNKAFKIFLLFRR